MKKIIMVIIFAAASVASFGQEKSDTLVTDSTALLTPGDYKELFEFIQEFPAKYANPINQWLVNRYNLRIQQWALKRKKPK